MAMEFNKKMSRDAVALRTEFLMWAREKYGYAHVAEWMIYSRTVQVINETFQLIIDEKLLDKADDI